MPYIVNVIYVGGLQLAAILADISKHVHKRTGIRHGIFFKMSIMRWAWLWVLKYTKK